MEVVMSRQCHCVLKNNLDEPIKCKDKEEALLKANEIIKILEKESCETHVFSIQENDNQIMINLKANPNKGY